MKCKRKNYQNGYCKKHFKLTEKMVCINCGNKLKIFVGNPNKPRKTPNFCSKECMKEYYDEERPVV